MSTCYICIYVSRIQNLPEGSKEQAESKMEEMERDSKMCYVGVMGLEDQLQRLVPESIQVITLKIISEDGYQGVDDHSNP